MTNASAVDVLLFVVLPYAALALLLIGAINRYRHRPFTVSSLSSQFLENRDHFWGIVPFHVGLGVVLLGHLAAFVVPDSILWWNSRPLRLWLLEITGLIFGVMTIIGLLTLIRRRLNHDRVRIVTSRADWALLGLLLVQLLTGVYVAVFERWGSSWFATALTPYLWSLVRLSPDLSTVSPLPHAIRTHIVGAWLIVAVVPFTRLMHVLVAPLHYFVGRRPQLVRWYRRPMGR